jgi:hypothetical protein
MTLHDTDMGPFEVDAPVAVPSEAAPNAAGGGGGAPLRPPSRGGISMRPAMVVLGLAVLILAVFITIGITTSQSPGTVRTSLRPSAVPGTSIRAVAAADVLAPIISSGEPPTNVINAVDIPQGAVRVSHQNNADESGQFDSQVVLRSGDSQGALLAFYAADLKQQGWQIFDKGAAANDPNATEVLGKLAGTDGYYWEIGVTVQATTFGAGTPAGGETDFTVRLLQEGDPE